MRIWMYVGIAGVAGSLSRYALSLAANPSAIAAVPYGTLLCNWAGSLLLGWLSETPWLARRKELRTAVTTGFIGSFTTFSSFSAETISLLEGGHAKEALIYGAASLIGGLLFVQLGHRLALSLQKREGEAR